MRCEVSPLNLNPSVPDIVTKGFVVSVPRVTLRPRWISQRVSRIGQMFGARFVGLVHIDKGLAGGAFQHGPGYER